MSEKTARNPLSQRLFELLACPDCKADLVYSSDKTALICVKEKTSFPIENGIPILLPKKAHSATTFK